MSLAKAPPVFIVGGGIIGLLSARALIHAGRRVAILERQQIGQESSWAGGGILSPLYPWRYPEAVNQLAFWGQAHYPQLVQDLEKNTGIDAQWRQSGMLILGEHEQQPALKWAADHHLPMQLLQSPALMAHEPGLSTHSAGLLLPAVAQIRNPRLLKALRQDLLQTGATINEQVSVTGFSRERGQLTEILTTNGVIAATECLITAGAWSGALARAAGLQLPINPVRGQMLLLRARPETLRHIILKDDRYLIPRGDGRILVGSTIEHAEFDKSTTTDARAELLRAATQLMPSLKDSAIEHHWAGLRPGSPEGIPYIGEHPKIRGLFVCAGHYRNGIVLGPASARLAADLILRRTPVFDPTPYQLPPTLTP